MASYKNPWHKPKEPMYGPRYFSTIVEPTEYRGYLIYNRIDGYGVPGRGVWDVVAKGGMLDAVCVTQRAGLKGAHDFIDLLLDKTL